MRDETLLVVTGTWQGFSVDGHNGRCGLGIRLARLMPEKSVMWFSVARKPTAQACTEAFEKAREIGVDWILWIDDDVVVYPNTYERLREVADEKERPVVSALAFFRQPPYWPSIFRYDRHPDGTTMPNTKPMPWLDYPRNQLVKVDATGLCATLIHRSVLDRIDTPWFMWEADGNGSATPDCGCCIHRLLTGSDNGFRTTTQW